METASPLILENLEYRFGSEPLFRNVSLELGAREFVTVMGRNGSGKSTLISLLLGAREASAGRIRFWGECSRTLDRRTLGGRIAWVVSEREFYPPFFRVRELFSGLRAFYPKWDRELERSLCEGFGIDTAKPLRVLSLGEAAKVKLIKALSIRPRLVVLDELTANLDPESKEHITRALIRQFADGEGMSVLYVCHSDEEAHRLSDRIYRLEPNGLLLTA